MGHHQKRPVYASLGSQKEKRERKEQKIIKSQRKRAREERNRRTTKQPENNFFNGNKSISTNNSFKCKWTIFSN